MVFLGQAGAPLSSKLLKTHLRMVCHFSTFQSSLLKALHYVDSGGIQGFVCGP